MSTKLEGKEMARPPHLLDPCLLALRRPPLRPRNLASANIMLELRDLDVERVQLLVYLLELRSPLLLLPLVWHRGAFPLLARLWLAREACLIERGLELRELRALRHPVN